MKNLQHDGTIEIATGRSRHEKSWKNKEILWSELAAKLGVTHRTAETFDEYLAAKKNRQDEIKDIGGFVGGYLSGGRRKASSVLHRQLLTLDIDHGKGDPWEDFTLQYGNAALVYSTHKHTPEAPRLRLVLPLDREVAPDEYEAIARRLAGNVGIDVFDDTTFEPSRLMYWPSTSKDGEFRFEFQDGPWLSADELLATYRDFRDTSEWPASSRKHDLVKRAIKKQGDPLEKPGIVGAFCRTYGIAEVIETYLDDVYETCDKEGRYTYKEGSTAAGLVVYDDRYAYSHHGTDPASGKLCNSFDLVRLHKFGLKDEDAKEDTPANKLPSYQEMLTFCTRDPRVKKQIGAERLEHAKSDFEGDWDADDPDDGESQEGQDDWLEKMDVDKKGNYLSTINNVVLVIANDPSLRGRMGLNQFEKREVALKDLPWRKLSAETRYLTDTDDASLRHYLESVYGISAKQKIEDGITIAIAQNSFHPVKDYLTSRIWDRRDRIDTLLIDYLGVEDTPYVRAVTRKTLVAAVARIMQPGCKFDHILTLVGDEGVGKSEIIKRLGRQWFSDSFTTFQGKEAYEAIQGAWLIELAELSGMKRSDAETVKHFTAKTEDRFRVAYGHRIETFIRQCIFIGTTNEWGFLQEINGNRRFWPVVVNHQTPAKSIFEHLNGYEVDQIWAEAVRFYEAGETLFLDKELEAEARTVQQLHTETDDRAGMIREYLEMRVPESWDEMGIYERRAYVQGDDISAKGVRRRGQVCVAEIWCEVLGGMQKEMNGSNTKAIHRIMSKMPGWKRSGGNRFYKHYGWQKSYVLMANGHEISQTELDELKITVRQTNERGEQ